jgi:hypothetical protein
MIDYGAGAYGRTAYGQWTDRTDGAAAIIAAATTVSIGGATLGGSGTVTAVSITSNVSADRIIDGASTISSDSGSLYGLGTFGQSDFGSDYGSMSVNWERIRLGEGTASASVTPTVVAKIIYQADGTVTATTTTSADSDVVVNGDGTAAAAASLAAVNYLRIRKASGSTAPVATFTASGRHKWQDITSSTGGAWDGEVDADVTWTNLTTPSKTWTELDSPYR